MRLSRREEAEGEGLTSKRISYCNATSGDGTFSGPAYVKRSLQLLHAHDDDMINTQQHISFGGLRDDGAQAAGGEEAGARS